jgi:hypothetical protein
METEVPKDDRDVRDVKDDKDGKDDEDDKDGKVDRDDKEKSDDKDEDGDGDEDDDDDKGDEDDKEDDKDEAGESSNPAPPRTSHIVPRTTKELIDLACAEGDFSEYEATELKKIWEQLKVLW